MAHNITIDGTQLSHKKIIIFGQNGQAIETTNPVSSTETAGWFIPGRTATFLVDPDTFSVVVQSGVPASFSFTVDAQGLVRYNSENEQFLEGAGTDTLILKGFPVKFDFRKLISGSVYIPSVMGNDGDPDLEWTSNNSYVLLPASGYAIIAGAGLPADLRFNISNSGVLSSDSQGNYFNIHNNKLTVTGYPITIDAQSIGYEQFRIELNNVPPSASGLISGNFIPLEAAGAYRMGGEGNSQIRLSNQYFKINALGEISVNDPSTLRVDVSAQEKRITLLKPLSRIITDISLSKLEVQVGESVKVEVKSSDPSATIRINGVFGSGHYLQFSSAGTKTVSVSAAIGDTYEISTIDVQVAAFSGIANLNGFPILQHTTLPTAAYKPSFSIPSEVFTNQDFTAHWDFGDGTSFITRDLAVEHDYEEVLGADQENHTFDVTCTIRQPNQPDVLVARTLYVHNIYARCKKLGTIIPKTSNSPVAERNGNNWGGTIHIKNIESEPLTFHTICIQSLTDDDNEVAGTLESLPQPLTVAPHSLIEFPISVPKEKIATGATGLSILLAGSHGPGLEVRAESFFEFPLKPLRQNTSRFSGLGVAPHITLQNFGFALPIPPQEGAECDPDNVPDEVADDEDSSWACKATTVTDTREVNSKFINAKKGDIILSPSGPSGPIGELLKSVDPPQYYGHCGIMTQNYSQITHCTLSDDRLNDHPNGMHDLPTTGFQPNAVKYGWPGVITQTVQNTIDGEHFTDHDTGKSYNLGGFPGNTIRIQTNEQPNPAYINDGAWQIVPAMVVKPDVLLELRYPQVRKILHRVAKEALEQTGKGHYRFYSYTDPTIVYDQAKFGPSDSGWAAGTFPAVCSSFIWYCIKNVQAQLETNNAIVVESDLEETDRQPYNGAEVNDSTRDGLYLYRANERLKAALNLSSAIKSKIQKKIDDIGGSDPFIPTVVLDLAEWVMDAKDNISNQMVNAFSSDWCDEEAKDSERWKDQFDANAISPDNMLMWDSPLNNGLYGYATPLVVTPKRQETVFIHRWIKTLLRGSLSGKVLYNGQPMAGASIQIANRTTFSDENGDYIVTSVPIGFNTLMATHTTGGTLRSANLPVHINESQNRLNINLGGPTGNYRKLIIRANIRVRGDDTRDNSPADRDAFGELSLKFNERPGADCILTKTAPNGQFGNLKTSARINLDRSIHIDLYASCSDFNGNTRVGSYLVGEGQTINLSGIHCEHNPTLGRSNFADITVSFENTIDPIDPVQGFAS